MSTPAQIPPPPSGYSLDSVPPPPAGYQMDSAPPEAQATISAVPPSTGWRDSLSRWAENVSNDVKYGTDTTGVGTVLKKMGAHGVYSGNPEAVGDFMASLPLGLLRSTKGAGEVTQPGQAWQGAKDIVGGAAQAATIPASFMAPEAGELATDATTGAAHALAGKALPSVMRQNAGKLFASVSEDAGSVPVALDNAQQGAANLLDWQGKINPGSIVNKFLQRVTRPNLPTMDYDEARQWYQVLGNMSADEASKLPPAVMRDVKGLVAGLKTDIGNAADQVGRAADYYQAMGDYAKAARLSEWLEAAKKWAIPAAIGAAGYKTYRNLSDLLGAK
jgi:hypothetical protein